MCDENIDLNMIQERAIPGSIFIQKKKNIHKE